MKRKSDVLCQYLLLRYSARNKYFVYLLEGQVKDFLLFPDQNDNDGTLARVGVVAVVVCWNHFAKTKQKKSQSGSDIS